MKKGDFQKQFGRDAEPALVLQSAMPESDPAFPILSGVLGIVPVSRWTFARVEPSGELESLFGSHAYGTGLPGLAAEMRSQRVKAPTGPRIAATLGTLDDFASGITLLFADARANYGILTLLRTSELGPFTSSEITVLTFALDAVSDRLSALRLQPQNNASSSRDDDSGTAYTTLPEADHYLLDTDFQIVMAWSADRRRVALTELSTRFAERLPSVLEETVRQLTAAWSGDSAEPMPGAARPVPFLVVRTQPLSGPSGLFIGVRIERFQPANSLTGAASQFRISPREVQVLALLLDGKHLAEVAKQLFITSSTVQDHIKSMLDKTGSNNRSELIARVLGWESLSNRSQR